MEASLFSCGIVPLCHNVVEWFCQLVYQVYPTIFVHYSWYVHRYREAVFIDKFVSIQHITLIAQADLRHCAFISNF